MKARFLVLAGLATVVVLGSPAAPAAAHPMGNFTVNTAATLELTPGQITIFYALDLAEIPTFQLLPKVDANSDRIYEEAELSIWAAGRASELVEGLSLEVEGQRASIEVLSSRAALRPGAAGLKVLRLDAVLSGDLPESGSARIEDANFADRIGWREITVAGANGIAVERSSVPVTSPSRRLTAYPPDLLTSPPDVREARFSYGPGAQAWSEPAGVAQGSGGGGGGSLLEDLVSRRSLDVWAVLLAFGVALGVGALHALAPGHGKTITAAYLAGRSARPRDAVGAGLAVAAMHTTTVLTLGVVLLIASQSFPAERVYPWLGIVAGGAAVALGVSQLVGRLRARNQEHGHPHEHPQFSPFSRRGLAALAVSGGLLPSPSAVLVLLGSFALGRAALGLGLVAAFGVGLAASLTVVGIFTLRARDLASRRFPTAVGRVVPIAGAGAIAAMGLVVAGRSLAQL